MDNYNTFLCNYTQYDKHCDPKNTFLWHWTQHPSSSVAKGSWKSRSSSENGFVRRNVLFLILHHKCSNIAPKSFCQENTAEYFITFAYWMHLSLRICDDYFTVDCRRQVKLHLWVSQLQSVYFCIWRKVDGFEGAGRFGAKQTARVSILKVNITLCLNYTPSALQFSHTLALSPLWVLFLLTPPLSWPS